MQRRHCLIALGALASGVASANPVAPVPGVRLAAQARFRYFGFEVYDLRLWAAPGFVFDDYERQPFVLELAYLRALKGPLIAERSIREMRGVGGFSDEQAQRWEAAMRRAFPDVARGDRLAGQHEPGQGVRFTCNGQPTDTVPDAEFARLFFGIWLSPRTSEPRLREALMADFKARQP